MQAANHIVADPDTITVRVPIVFRRRSRGKSVISPGGSLSVAASHARNNTAIVRAIVRAFRWRKLIETGVYSSLADLAAVERVNDSYASRVVRLTLLSPDIVEAILSGRNEPSHGIARLVTPLPLSWEEQRSLLRR